MSQSGQYITGVGPTPFVESLSGNDGVVVTADAGGNISIWGHQGLRFVNTAPFADDPAANTLSLGINYLSLPATNPSTSYMPGDGGNIIDAPPGVGVLYLAAADPDAPIATDRFLHGYASGGLVQTWVGPAAGNFTMTGVENVGVGNGAGSSLTTGSHSVFVGDLAGFSVQDGDSNTFIGYLAGQNQVSGNFNVAVGAQALFSCLASDNTAVGFQAGQNVTTGVENVFVGSESGDAVTTGQANAAVGYGALSSATTASDNVAIGYGALSMSNVSGQTAVGFGALFNASTGERNTAAGYLAANDLTSGNDNFVGGSSAMPIATTASQNVIIGSGAGAEFVAGSRCIVIGYNALNNFDPSVGADDENIAIGNLCMAGMANVGDGNVCLGAEIMNNANGGSNNNNVFIGHNVAGTYTYTAGTGLSNNVAVGYKALEETGNRANCIAIGYFAMGSGGSGTGGANIAIGEQCMYNVGNANTNIGIGNDCLLNISTSTAVSNIIVGHRAGYYSTTGRYNTAVGHSAFANFGLGGITTGENNVGIGYLVGENYRSSESNNILISNAGTATDSGRIRIGTAGTQTTCFISGITGVTPGNASPKIVVIDSAGQLGTGVAAGIWTWSTISDNTTAVVGTGYIMDTTGKTLTLPASAAVGDEVAIVGKGVTFSLAAGSGDTLRFVSTTTTGGTDKFQSTELYDAMHVVCITANSDWVVRSATGNFSVV